MPKLNWAGRSVRFATLLGLCALATTARADLIIDQQNTTNSTFAVTALPYLGQSFTPTLSSLDFVSLVISNTSASTYKVQIFRGAGYGGTLLGESATYGVALAPLPANGQPFSVDNAQPVEFDFAAPVALAGGGVYTLRALQVTGAGGYMFLRTGLNNPYAGGQAYAIDPIPAVDFVFAEGIHGAAVPAPASLAMWAAAGLVALGARARRRR